MLLRARPHKDVDVAIVEGDEHIRHHMGRQMLAHLAAGIGQAIGKLVRLRQQQQARIVVDKRGKDDEIGFDRVV